MIAYDKFQRALSHLELQFNNYRSLDNHQPLLIQEAVAESVIQRFETCYDCLWKVLKRYLRESLGVPDLPNSPKPILRIAHENSLLLLPPDRWMAYADARTGTAHDYSGEKARAALLLMESFLEAAIALYQRMSEKTWTRLNTLSITAKHHALLLELITQHLPNTAVWAYGSRVKGTARPHSDLDLVVFTTAEQSPQLSALNEAFQASALPFRIDILAWDTMPEQFQKNIDTEHAVLVNA